MKQIHKTMTFNNKIHITIEQLAEHTGYCEPHLRRLAQAGTIPARKIGHRWWLNELDVLAALSHAPIQHSGTGTGSGESLIAGL